MGKSEALAELNKFMDDMWRDIERSNREEVARKAAANPKAYKLSKVLKSSSRNGGDGSHTHHFGGEDKRGTRYYFCVADHVNVAGYVLTWRERWFKIPRGKQGVRMKRDQWAAKKTHTAAVKLAKARAKRSREKVAYPTGKWRVTAERTVRPA
jgi:hypothetical protein